MTSEQLAKELKKRGCPLDCVDVFVTVVKDKEAKLKIANESLLISKRYLEIRKLKSDNVYITVCKALKKIQESE